MPISSHNYKGFSPSGGLKENVNETLDKVNDFNKLTTTLAFYTAVFQFIF